MASELIAPPGARLATALAPICGGAARAMVGNWLGDQRARVGDPAHAARFSAHSPHFDAPAEAYAHRLIEAGGADVLAGIRFYGGDRARPFVEVIDWSRPVSVDALIAAMRADFAAFSPRALRLLLPAREAPFEAKLDQSVHAALPADMSRPRGAAELAETDDIETALAILEETYGAVAAADPALGAEILPADRDDLADCLASGTLHLILADDGRQAGVIATLPGQIGPLAGHVVVEEAVRPAVRGRGLAAEAQRRLAVRFASVEPETPIIGTIHRLNTASRRSAEAAGRPAVLDYLFFDL